MLIRLVQLVGFLTVVLLGLGECPHALSASKPLACAGIFILDGRFWWGPACAELSGAAPNAPLL